MSNLTEDSTKAKYETEDCLYEMNVERITNGWLATITKYSKEEGEEIYERPETKKMYFETNPLEKTPFADMLTEEMVETL